MVAKIDKEVYINVVKCFTGVLECFIMLHTTKKMTENDIYEHYIY